MKHRPAIRSPRGLLSRLARCRRGATAVEFAFGLPIFLALVYMLFEFARIFWSQSTLEFAVEEGARLAMVNPSATTDQVVTKVTNSAVGLPAADLTIAVTFTDVNGSRGLVDITGTYAYAPFVPVVIPFFGTASTIDFRAFGFDIVTSTQMSIVQ